jgi:type II secretory pathway component GspD/PulD (secretin)
MTAVQEFSFPYTDESRMRKPRAHFKMLGPKFILLALSILRSGPSLAQDDLVFTLAFREASISLITRAIADVSGRTILFESPGKDRIISLTTQSSVTREEVWRIFEQALNDHGLELTKAGEVWRIVPTMKDVVLF